MSNLYIPGCAFFISLLLLILFYSKKRVNNIETKIYLYLLLTNVLDTVLMLIILCLYYFNYDLTFLSFLSKFEYLALLGWIWLFFIYVIYYLFFDGRKEEDSFNNITKITGLITFFAAILILFLPVSIYSSDGIMYSYGPALNVVYYLSLLYSVLAIILIFFFICISIQLIEYLINILNIEINRKTGNNIYENYLDHLFLIPLRILHLKDNGEIIKRTNELSEVEYTVTNFFLELMLSSVYILSLICALTFIKFQLSLFILVMFFIVILVMIRCYKKLSYKINEYMYASTDYNNYLHSYLNSFYSVKHMNAIKYVKDILNDKYKSFSSINATLLKSVSQIELIKKVFLGVSEFVILTYLLVKSFNGSFSYENVIVIYFIINYLFSSFNSVINLLPSFIIQKKVIRKINEFYNISLKVDGGDAFKQGNIKFENVSFSYNNYKKTIDSLSFEIKENEHVRITGESGSGKSTIMKLINKEYENYEGTISIGNKNIKDIDESSYRENVEYLSQEESFINGTIKDNILFGRKTSEEELNRVIKICKIDSIVEKYPLKLETYISSNNNPLSGGEKGLIILARGLLKRKSIIIIDEVLSELDLSFETEVLKNIDQNIYSTIIYITHKNVDVFKKLLSVRKE